MFIYEPLYYQICHENLGGLFPSLSSQPIPFLLYATHPFSARGMGWLRETTCVPLSHTVFQFTSYCVINIHLLPQVPESIPECTLITQLVVCICPQYFQP